MVVPCCEFPDANFVVKADGTVDPTSIRVIDQTLHCAPLRVMKPNECFNPWMVGLPAPTKVKKVDGTNNPAHQVP